jgi:RimJ/RimL family protein N-acetyltransferase
VRLCIDACEKNEARPYYVRLHVAEYNQEAINLYRKLGFREVKLIKKYYKILGKSYDAIEFLDYINNPYEPVLFFNRIKKVVRLIGRMVRACRHRAKKKLRK